MSFLATDLKKVSATPNLNNHNLDSGSLSLPQVDRISSATEGKVYFVTQTIKEPSLAENVKVALSQTSNEELGSKKDNALILLRERITSLAHQEPKPVSIDEVLKGNIDKLKDSVQSLENLGNIAKFQNAIQGLVPESQIAAASALLDTAEKISKSPVGQNRKFLAPIYEEVAKILDPANDPQYTSLSKNSLILKIDELNKVVGKGTVAQGTNRGDAEKRINWSEQKVDALQALVLSAEKLGKSLPERMPEKDKISLLEPFASRIGEILLSK